MKPLEGIRIIDFSQFLAGPAASLRLADLGAEVIKIERPGSGDICRKLYVAKQKVGSESTIFLAINRNKKSIALNLKDPQDKMQLLNLIKTADVVLQNFRPYVAERLGIDFESLKKVNPNIIYGSVTGYTKNDSPWLNKPGQDLLAQSLSGLTWKNTNNKSPTPMGLSIGNLMAAYDLTQGVLSLLVRKGITGKGGLVEVSLIESLLNIQSVPITEYLNKRSIKKENINYIKGIYKTIDGFVALDAIPVNIVNEILNLNENDDIIRVLENKYSDELIGLFIKSNIHIEPVYNWKRLLSSKHYQMLNVEQVIKQGELEFKTTRCPISIDGERYYSNIGAPTVGEHNKDYLERV